MSLEGVKKRVLGLSGLIPKAVAAARRDLAHCNGLRLDALEHAAQALVLNPNSAEACSSLRIGAQAVAALFGGAMATTDEIEVLIGKGPPARVPSSTATRDMHDVGNWTHGFFMSAICRENSLLDSLCCVPIDLLRLSRTRGLEDSYVFVEALQAYVRKEGHSRERALAALQAARDPNLPEPTIAATRELAIPTIEVFLRLLENHALEFNRSLVRGLELHRQYWSREAVAKNPVGYISLPLTGLASLAHDAGIAITVESDYLPMALVRGECRPGA